MELWMAAETHNGGLKWSREGLLKNVADFQHFDGKQ
jgi:hypothetical protein